MKLLTVRATLLLLLLTCIFISSCTKKQDSDVSNAIWNVGTIQYTATAIKKQGSSFIATSGLNSMQVCFATLPTVTTGYKIADANKVNNNSLAPYEAGIIFTVESTDQYLSTGTASDSVSVAVQNGVMTIKLSSTPVQHYAGVGGPALDLNTASGVIKTDKYQ